MSLAQINPFDYFSDTHGDPLDQGYIYVGAANQDPKTNPIAIYYDAAMTIPAPQPLRTVAGYISNPIAPQTFFTNQNYSVSVRDKNQIVLFYVANFSSIVSNTPFALQLAASNAWIAAFQAYTQAWGDNYRATNEAWAANYRATNDAWAAAFQANLIQRYLSFNNRGNWATGTGYAIQDLVIQGSIAYICLVAHTSGVFSTDLANGDWAVYQGATKSELGASNGADLVGTTGGKTQQAWNNIVIRPEQFGAIGDGVADDTAAVQAALNYATIQKKPLVCDGKYKLTSKILGTILWGLTSIGSGGFIITFDDDVFEFSGITQGAIFSNLSFTPTVATATHKAILIFKYQFHCIGLKIDRCQVNGFTNCGWNFLKLLKIGGTGGFFGGFCYTNNRTSLIWNDIDLENADWVNSCTFSNNFKFYGNYGVYVPAGSVLYDCNVHGWWGQQTAGIIYALDGGFNKCSIISMLNWDTNVVALTMGVNSRGNTVAKTYTFDIFDLGYMNKIVTDDYTYASNAVTAISNTLFTETAQGNKNSFAAIFSTVTAAGAAVARNGILPTFGAGLKQNGYWMRTTTAGDSYLLDTLDKTVLGSDPAGKYDQYSTLRWFLDFSVGSTNMDDKAIKIGFGTAVTTATPVAGTFLTNIGGNFVIATFDASNVATTLYSLGAIKLGRNQVQFISPGYQSNLTTASAIHFNNNFVGRFTLDLNLYKRPIIQIMSTTLQTTLGLLYCDIRTNQAANLA